MPLAFTQEDFLVFVNILLRLFKSHLERTKSLQLSVCLNKFWNEVEGFFATIFVVAVDMDR